MSLWQEEDLRRRLPWLLLFRVSIATVILLFAIAATFSSQPHEHVVEVLYGVAIGTYVLVLFLGLVLRSGGSPLVVAIMHLTTAVMAAMMVVQATGGKDSTLSFLFLLAILDGAILAGRTIALAMASASSIAYGALLVAQFYGVWNQASDDLGYGRELVVHLCAFYLIALLSGRLAEQLKRASIDVTELRHNLLRAQYNHQVVMESLPVGAITIDSDGLVRALNPAAQRQWGDHGLSLDAPLPDILNDNLPEPGQPKEVWVGEGDAKRAYALSLSDIGKPKGMDEALFAPGQVLVVEDRTQLKSLEDSLHTKRRLSSLGELAAAVSHELRNPLAAISGSVELISSGHTNAAAQARLFGIIRRELERLDVLVGDFVEYARPSKARVIKVDMRPFLENLREAFVVEAKTRDHVLQLEVPEEFEARFDPALIRRALWNILVNAAEASEEGKPIVLKAERIFDGNAATVEISVRDQGEGVAERIRHHLFEPFKTTRRAGSGLGLAVAYGILDTHGGTILVDSQEGEGACFTMVLPQLTAANDAPHETSKATA